MTRLLVTGGAGFIGSHIVEMALEDGLEVAVFDNFSSGHRRNVPDGVRIFDADIRSQLDVMHAFHAFRPDLVSHHAAQVSVPRSLLAPHIDAEINVVGGVHVLDACVAVGVKRLVFASSGGAVYGDVTGFTEYAHETHPTAPVSPYGVHKLTFEMLLQVYREQHALESVVLRYANVYGPRQSGGESGVVSIFMQMARSGEPLTVFGQQRAGDGGCVRDYVFVDDVVAANRHALLQHTPFRTLNVATGYATSALHLARTVIEVSGSRSIVKHAEPRRGDVARSVLSPVRFTELLGAPTLLRDGLPATWTWYGSSCATG